MIRRILISLIVLTGVTAPEHKASGAVPPFRSDRLEAMAEALGEATIAVLPDGVHSLSWAGTPVSVVKNAGTVEHIGYALFSEEQRSVIGTTISRFLVVKMMILFTHWPISNYIDIIKCIQYQYWPIIFSICPQWIFTQDFKICS